MSTKYRRLAARGNFQALDRTDIQTAVKDIARDMAQPKQSSWKALIRLGKYLKGKLRLAVRFRYQPISTMINVFTDADWAGDKLSRKSTSGGLIQMGNHCIKSWSSTQTVIALSSGESEFYAIVKGATQALGTQSFLRDLGYEFKVKIFTDASTGKSIASRRGLGKVRHLDVSQLWIQEKVKAGDIQLLKIKNVFNSADCLTKHLDYMTLCRCLEQLDMHFVAGRSEIAPDLNIMDGNTLMPILLQKLQIHCYHI